MRKTLSFLAFVICLAGIAGFGFMLVEGYFQRRFNGKALVWLIACGVLAFGMWRRFRHPPKDPDFARKTDGYSLPVFWLLATAFAWGIAVAPFLRREVRDLVLFLCRLFGSPLGNYAPLTFGTTLLTYAAICWTAALFLARSNRKAGTTMAIGHAIAGFVWMGYVIWAYHAFSLGFR